MTDLTNALQKENVEMTTNITVTTIKKESKNLYLPFKRLLDIVISSVALILLAPFFLVVMILIRLESKGSPIYCQTRVGKNGKEFKMYKFRSMCIDADKKLAELQHLNEREGPVFKISNDPRVTKVGNFIRKTCIDELPQLVNILKSDMSLVGPRPPLPNEVIEYKPYHFNRLNAKPGLTCFWQISNRKMSFNKWVSLDLKYINEMSFITDIKIMFLTFKVIFRLNGEK